jgi:two-component system cell cycle response regulator
MKYTILIVDAHLDIVQFLNGLLNSQYRVITAENGEIALTLLKNETINVVISDIKMPVMDGFILLHKIKTDCETSHIPVVLLTANSTLKAKLEGLELGADIYIEKPFSPKYLLAQISSLLNNRIKIKEYYASSPLVHLSTIAHQKTDKDFLEKLHSFMNENLSNSELQVEDIASHFYMSRATIYRKLNALTDLSPKEYLNTIRLKKAATLLLEKTYTIREIISIVGFNSQSYFSQSFLNQFGVTPTYFVQSNKTVKIASVGNSIVYSHITSKVSWQ